MAKRSLFILALTAMLASGCFDIEQSIVLDRDLSGTATFDLTMDMEPMVYMMASMQKAFSGQEGPPTKEELDAARQQMLSQKETEPDRFDFDEEEIRRDLPEGVRLLGVESSEEGMRITTRIRFAFDHVSKLAEIDLSSSEGSEDEPMDEPFGAFVIEDEGDTMLIRSPALNPLDEIKSDPQASMVDTDEMSKLFESLRVAFVLTLPFEILEENATSRKGDTLSWVYDLETLQSMGESTAVEGIRVRFKK